MLDRDLVLAQLVHHVLLPVFQLKFKLVHIVVQLVYLLLELSHEVLLDSAADRSHQFVQLALVADPQLNLVLHFALQLGNHLLQLRVYLHWVLASCAARILMRHTCQ